MKHKLPTREECQEIIKSTDAFYVTKTIVEGCNVELYDYRLASISDFTEHNAFELRGLTFIEISPGVWERYILLNKFFNINQTIGWMEEDVKHKKIVKIQDKLDGSVISFVKFPNGTIRAKSKMSFSSEQAQMAQELFDTNGSLRMFITEQLKKDHTPIFELCSPENQIVLEYEKTELVLLQIRDDDGTYFNETYKQFICKKYMISQLAHTFNVYHIADDFVLPHLLSLKGAEEGIEGWVVTFEDGQMAKIKTDWYLQLHGLIGPDAFRENLLVKTILDDNIDDVISNLVPGVKRDKIEELTTKVQHEFDHLVVEYKSLRSEYFNKYNENRKDFAIKYSKTHELFGPVMKRLNTSFRDVEATAKSAVKEYMLKRCNSLGSAKEYVEGL